MDFTCPKCGGLTYSRKARMCGQCGTPLPREMILTDEEAQAAEQERQWAKDLADKFDTTGKTRKKSHEDKKDRSAQEKYEIALAESDKLIRQYSFASEFKHRPRHWVWFIFAAELLVVMALLIDLSYSLKIRMPWPGCVALLAILALSNWTLWSRANPICPNCKQNIRTCLTNHCHVCGKPISHGRCVDCGVDHTWTGWFRPMANGSHRMIIFCPDCGVHLDTCIPRWQARR